MSDRKVSSGEERRDLRILLLTRTLSSSKRRVKWRISANWRARACSCSKCCVGLQRALVRNPSRPCRAPSAQPRQQTKRWYGFPLTGSVVIRGVDWQIAWWTVDSLRLRWMDVLNQYYKQRTGERRTRQVEQIKKKKEQDMTLRLESTWRVSSRRLPRAKRAHNFCFN